MSITHQKVNAIPDDPVAEAAGEVVPSDWNAAHTVSLADGDIPASIARDAEVTAAVAAEATLARNADNLASGTVADARIASTIARDSEVTSAVGAEATARDAAIATHAGLSDPHPGYLTPAEGNAAYDAAGAAAVVSAAAVLDGDAAGGQLAGTYPNPTVAASHSGSAHHDPVTVGTGLDLTGQLIDLDLSEVAAGGELAGFMDAPTVDATHSGSTHAATQAAAEATAAADVDAHEAAGDPHTGYRLESADHSHASTGAQGGTVAHTALTGVSADQHHAQTHATAHQPSGADAMAVDAAQATGSLRTITTSAAAAVGTAAAGNGTAAASSNHVHPTGAGTPSTQAFGDAAATGSGPAAAMTDHKHAMPARPFSIGSSNPGSPATNDIQFRTDLGMFFQYDGTRWLCTCPHTLEVANQHVLLTLSATNSIRAPGPGAFGCSDIYLTTLNVAIYVTTTNDGSNYWAVAFGATSVNTSADAANTVLRKTANINALWNFATDKWFQVDFTKTGSGGAAYPMASLSYRYVAP